jgi:hypothetical protein
MFILKFIFSLKLIKIFKIYFFLIFIHHIILLIPKYFFILKMYQNDFFQNFFHLFL